MKKITLILLAICLSVIGMAQSKTDTTKKVVQPVAAPAPVKKEFQVNLEKTVPLQLNINLPGYVIDDYFTYELNGHDRLKHATDITALRLTSLEENHQLMLDSLKKHLNTNFQNWVIDEKKKWTAAQKADSVAAAKPAGKPLKTN